MLLQRGDATPKPGVRLGVAPLRRVEPSAGDDFAPAPMEEITTALAQFRWITCVPRMGAVAALAQGWDALPELDFLLDGTIQRSGSHVRIIVRLSDMRAGGSLV